MLDERGVWRGLHLGDQRRLGPWSDPPRAARPGLGGRGSGLALSPPPALDRAHADDEEVGRLGLGEASVDGSQQPLAEVGRILLHRPSLARNQLFRNLL